MIERSVSTGFPHSFTSRSGQIFEFSEYAIDENPEGENDLHLFCTEGMFGFNAVFIGKAKDLRERLKRHEQREAAKKKGATKLLVHSQPTVRATPLEEAEALLIQELRPAVNIQKTGVPGGKFTPGALAS